MADGPIPGKDIIPLPGRTSSDRRMIPYGVVMDAVRNHDPDPQQTRISIEIVVMRIRLTVDR